MRWEGKYALKTDRDDEILNIIPDGDGYRVKQSYIKSGYYNCDIESPSFEDGVLSYGINDEAHRRIYRLSPSSDGLRGTYMQYGKTTEILFKKLSDTPEDGEPYYKPPIKVPESELSRLELLKKYRDYDDKDYGISLSYTLFEKDKMRAVADRFGLDALFAGKEGDELISAVFSFVCDNFKHNGQSGMPKDRDVAAIIDYCDAHDGKINCRGLALMLAGLLRVYGIEAAHITCMPYEEPFNDCHVVVECPSPKYGKRIMLDPTYRLILSGEDGVPLNLSEPRRALIDEKPLKPNPEANYNGSPFDLEDYRGYMQKNTFRFRRSEKAYYGCEDGRDGNRQMMLVPTEYVAVCGDMYESDKNSLVTNDKQFWG